MSGQNKSKNQPRYTIGIDLGTTNCVLAYFDRKRPERGLQVLTAPQWEAAGAIVDAEQLPSFLYLPAAAEKESFTAGGGPSPPLFEGWISGALARDRMAFNPGRVIHSAKSWLCHMEVDRMGGILPWQSDEIPAEYRLSPVEASSAYLAAFRRSWDFLMAAEDPAAAFDLQEIVITVPASFDEAAQQLTLEAARAADFPQRVRLIEEPQAAFYYWLDKSSNVSTLVDVLERTAGKKARVLVCDIGGGTTDLSLFEVGADAASATGLALKRVAVSDHLLLGGDNIDLTLAYILERKLTGGDSKLSGRQWNQILAQARDLKERLLSDEAGIEGDKEFPVTLAGKGSGLFASTLSAAISADEVRDCILNGFFPLCGAEEKPARKASGLKEWGLPYAGDSAVSRHLAAFLDGQRVDAVLFNGGTVTPDLLRGRLLELLASWQDGKRPLVLNNDSLALAVARGAARYAYILQQPQEGDRIAGGHAHALYLEVARRGKKKEKTLVCILPRGMEADQSVRIAEPEFELLVNQPVRFQCYYSATRKGDKPGDIVSWADDDYHPLPPLQTAVHLPPERPKPANDRVRVTLECTLNELGLLRLYCLEPQWDERWRLDFNLRRGIEVEEGQEKIAASLVPPERLARAEATLRSLFGKKKDPSLPEIKPRQLVRELEKIFGPREEWDSATLRALWPSLNEGMTRRSRGVEHEAAWLYLAGYALRPGYGVELDESRIEQLWRAFSLGISFPKETRIQDQWYLMWRRTAGGLNAQRQEKLFEKIEPLIRIGGSTPNEALRLAGALERLRQDRKAQLVKKLASGLTSPRVRNKEPYAWALGRLLTRTPLYAGADGILPPKEVEKLFEKMRDLDWKSQEYAPLNAMFALAARRTEERGVDVCPEVREALVAKMKSSRARPHDLEVVRDLVPVEYADRVAQFGESLPGGLLLVGK